MSFHLTACGAHVCLMLLMRVPRRTTLLRSDTAIVRSTFRCLLAHLAIKTATLRHAAAAAAAAAGTVS
eukprot:21070-Heterococcus_DN1.PRE.3